MRPTRPRIRTAALGLALSMSLSSVLADSPPQPAKPQVETPILFLIKRLYDEAREVGRYPGEDFHRGDYFLGEGDDDTNKTHHVGILIRDEPAGPRMTVRVTRLVPSRDDPKVRFGRDTKMLVCRLAEDGAEVLSSDFAAAELAPLLARIVRAVTDKKALLKLKR